MIGPLASILTSDWLQGGVTELHWELRHAKESFHQAVVSLDCDQATMVTQHGKPMFTKVTHDTSYIATICIYNIVPPISLALCDPF